MAKARRGWYEREEIQKVTLDWVKLNCRVTSRDMELIELIRDRKLVRRDHLEVISPSFRNFDKSIRAKMLNKTIRRLFDKMIIDKVHEVRELGKGGNNPCTVALDRGGSVLLRIPHKKRIQQKKEGKYIRRSLPTNYRHINGINQCEVETILFCEETGSEILEWVHEKPQELHYGQERVVVIPDVRVALKMREKPFYAFLEFDTGSENARYSSNFPIIHEKLVKYKKYKSSNLWDTPYFPVLLFVTEDDKRVEYFNKKCKELGLQGFGIYYENYRAFLERLAITV